MTKRNWPHTPGPWTMRERPNSGGGHFIEPGIATVHGAGRIPDANARLIKEAPALLEALEIWMRFFDEMPKGQFGKIVCDIGLMNEGFIKSRRALAAVKGA